MLISLSLAVVAIASLPATDIAPSSRFSIEPYLQDVRADSAVVVFTTEAMSVALVHYEGAAGQKGAVATAADTAFDTTVDAQCWK